MNLVFKSNINAESLYPFSLLNSVEELRVGILTIREKWSQALNLFPGLQIDIEIPDNLLPDLPLYKDLQHQPLSSIIKNQHLNYLTSPWHLFQYNGQAIENDFYLVSHQKKSAIIQPSIKSIIGKGIFIESTAKVDALSLDASDGPIYIGDNASIMAGSSLKGPISIGENSIVKMGASIYGGTTIGRYCTVGGEVKNSNIMDFSNKAHHGYLGDSVIGTWCNLGAGTTVSNVKNNASPVKVWDCFSKKYIEVGLKCGTMMGDFSKSAINSSFNSGTIVGICSNIFNSGVLLPKFIPDFTWGNMEATRYELEKLKRDIQNWMNLKKMKVDEKLITRIENIYNKQR